MSNDTVLADPPAPPPPDKPGMSTGDKVRFVLRGIGQTLITAGLVVLLFVVYEVWITNIFADRNNERHISQLRKEFNDRDIVDPLNLPSGKVANIKLGSNIGILYMPRLGRDYAEAIVQGGVPPDDQQLEQGTAHYGETQLPGQKGNFAVAGHRVGHGEPFLNLDQLRAGDAVIVETKTWWYVYRVLGTPNGSDPQKATPYSYRDADGKIDKIPGREIVDPEDGNVLFPIPNDTSAPLSDATQRLMTMTTCHPKFTASQRMIIHAILDTKVSADGSAMPAAIKALYGEVSS